MYIVTHELLKKTEKHTQLIDLTPEISALVKKSKLYEGSALIYSMHTTAAIRIQENEPGLLQDLEDFLKKVVPKETYYRHDDFDIRTVNMNPNEKKNGPSHIRDFLLGAHEQVPIKESKLLLGRYQSIFFVELDGPRDRKIIVQLSGIRK